MAGRTPTDEQLLEEVRRARLDTVAGAFAYGGGQELTKPGLGLRRRTRLTLSDGRGENHVLYLKRYGPERFGTWLCRLAQQGRPVSAARVEFENILATRTAGIPTMRAILFGEDGPWFGCRSYIIVTAVPGDALARRFEQFLAAGAGQAVEELTRKLAALVCRLHAAGYVHRDLYASHVFLDDEGDRVELYLIDLARMFRPRWRRFRWRVKDLAQLKYSMPPAWVDHWWDLFLREYLVGRDRAWKRYARAAARKVRSMRRRDRRRCLARKQ